MRRAAVLVCLVPACLAFQVPAHGIARQSFAMRMMASPAEPAVVADTGIVETDILDPTEELSAARAAAEAEEDAYGEGAEGTFLAGWHARS